MHADPVPAERPLIVLSAAVGYGGAERNIEILVRHMAATRRIVVFASDPLHLAELGRIDHPNLTIETVDAADRRFVDKTAGRLIATYLDLGPASVFANTFLSTRALARACLWLPGLDAVSSFAVRDFFWHGLDRLTESLNRATLIVPDRSVLERPGYIGGLAWPNGRQRAVVAPNPVELPPEPPAAPAADAPFLHLAAVNSFKGHSYLVDALALLKRRGHAITARSYGLRSDPILYACLLDQIAAADIGDTLVLGDHVPDPSPLITTSAAVLVTSVGDHGGPETFGRSIIEAWAHGRPVIAFAAGGPARMIRHEVDGLLVAEKDVAGLAAAMLRLKSDPELAARLGRSGRRRAEAEFAAAIAVPRLVTVLDGGWSIPHTTSRAFDGDCANAPDASTIDVTDALVAGWAGTSAAASGIEGTDTDSPTVAGGALVCRDRAAGVLRPLLPHELEFLAQGRGDLAGRAAALLAALPQRPEPAPPRTGLAARGLAGVHRAAGHMLSKIAPVRRTLVWLARRPVRPRGPAASPAITPPSHGR